jgi:hypothetical protein
MSRIETAGGRPDGNKDCPHQYEAYEKTLRMLEDIDGDDDDEGIAVVTDWLIEQIGTKDQRPSSRAVRKQATKFCRENGYRVRDDSWPGA